MSVSLPLHCKVYSVFTPLYCPCLGHEIVGMRDQPRSQVGVDLGRDELVFNCVFERELGKAVCMRRVLKNSVNASVLAMRRHGDITGDRTQPLPMTWVLANGEEKKVTCYSGQTLLEVATEHDLPVEGACGGVSACSTCHVYLEPSAMSQFGDPTDQENDMLDLAFFPTPCSRLGCQLKVQRGTHDGLRVTLPKATRNMAVDGHVEKPH